MAGKKSKTPAPNYREMANRYATWQHEDQEWYRISMEEAKNIHNRELGRAKARYAAAGGNVDKIAEIEAEHGRKLAETESEIGEKYKEKQQTLAQGPTRRQLFDFFRASTSHSFAAKAAGIKDEKAREEFLKENKVTLSEIDQQLGTDDIGYYAPKRYLAQFAADSPVVSEEAFTEWARSYGNFKEPARAEEKMEEIKTRRGERPRRPIMGNIPVEQNPWI